LGGAENSVLFLDDGPENNPHSVPRTACSLNSLFGNNW
jgi:hypothetical protein